MTGLCFYPINPCDDCVDGECTMNCSTPMKKPEPDFGSLFITHEKNGKTVTVIVRSPQCKNESKVSLPLETWNAMIATRLTTCAVPDGRDAIQRKVIEWGERCFGADHMRDKIVRAARFIEEAAELVQAVGLSKDHAQRALDHVYSRPAGDIPQELGGVSNTQYALAGALGLSVEECEAKEIARCLAKTPEHFAQRNRDKIEKIDAATPPAQEGK